MSELLSVIVPVYNTAPYLDRCLDSICGQQYSNLEIICVNDGSTDSSGSILDDYAKSDNRICIVTKENGGLVSARKAGFNQASGKYITYVDSDDWIEPDMYQRMMHIMESYTVDLVASGFIRDYGNYSYVDNEDHPGIFLNKEFKSVFIDHFVDFEKPFGFSLTASFCNKLFIREKLEKYQLAVPDYISIDEDTVCTYPYILDASGIYVMEASFYHYCLRENSMLNSVESPSEEKYKSICKAYEYLAGKIPQEISNYLEQYAILSLCPEYAMSYKDGVLFPYGMIGSKKRIVVYGSGIFGRHLYKYILNNTDLQIVAWVDKNGDGETILLPSALKTLEYDCILVSVLLSDIQESIKSDLSRLGIKDDYIKCLRIMGDV